MKKDGNWVYEAMMGYSAQESSLVENAFAPGRRCDKLYGRVYDANERLCERLGVDEDPDVEEIISCFLEMNRELCLRMYRYGSEFGGEE